MEKPTIKTLHVLEVLIVSKVLLFDREGCLPREGTKVRWHHALTAPGPTLRWARSLGDGPYGAGSQSARRADNMRTPRPAQALLPLWRYSFPRRARKSSLLDDYLQRAGWHRKPTTSVYRVKAQPLKFIDGDKPDQVTQSLRPEPTAREYLK